MSLGRTQGVGLSGVNGFVVEVEAHVAGGLPGFVISGLGDSAVKQAQSGLARKSSLVDGMLVNQRRVTLNLPAGGPTEGRHRVRPGHLRRRCGGDGDRSATVVRDVVRIGEIGLDGSVRGVAGVPCSSMPRPSRSRRRPGRQCGRGPAGQWAQGARRGRPARAGPALAATCPGPRSGPGPRAVPGRAPGVGEDDRPVRRARAVRRRRSRSRSPPLAGTTCSLPATRRWQDDARRAAPGCSRRSVRSRRCRSRPSTRSSGSSRTCASSPAAVRGTTPRGPRRQGSSAAAAATSVRARSPRPTVGALPGRDARVRRRPSRRCGRPRTGHRHHRPCHGVGDLPGAVPARPRPIRAPAVTAGGRESTARARWRCAAATSASSRAASSTASTSRCTCRHQA